MYTTVGAVIGVGDQYLTPTDLSDLLGVSPQTLAHWRYAGTGPAFVKAGKYVRYPASSLGNWLQSRTISPDQATTT